MQEKVLKLKVITPLYNQGMDGDVGLKIPSLRGVLRFWWRALKSENNIPILKIEEQKVFGGISGAAMASPVKFRLIKEADTTPVPFSKSTISGRAKYLSLGLFGMNSPDRMCIESGCYHVAMYCPNEVYEDLRRTILAFHYYGNLGAKARNGFGSLFLTNFEEFCDEETNTPEKFFKTINSQTILPHYSAFSSETKLFESLETFSSAGDALSRIAEMYNSIRSSVDDSYDYSIRKYLSYPIGPRVNERCTVNATDGRYSKPYFFKVYRQTESEYKVLVLNLVHKYAHGLDQSSQNYNRSEFQKPTLQKDFEHACKVFNTKLVDEQKFREVK